MTSGKQKRIERARRDDELRAIANDVPLRSWENKGLDPSKLKSSSLEAPKQEIDEDNDEPSGPPRYTGEMIWAHKTAPMLQIHGKKPLSPEDIAAGRRR